MAQTRLTPLVHPSWEEGVNERFSQDQRVIDFRESLKEALDDVMASQSTGSRGIKPLKSGSGLFVPDPNTSRQKIVLGDKQTIAELQSKFKGGDKVRVIGKDGKKNNRFVGELGDAFHSSVDGEVVWVSFGGTPCLFRLDSYDILPYSKDYGSEIKKLTALTRKGDKGDSEAKPSKAKPSFPIPLTELSPTIKLLTSLLKKKEPEPQLEILESICDNCKGFIFYQKEETPSCHRCNP